jgi:hypothetical protein
VEGKAQLTFAHSPLKPVGRVKEETFLRSDFSGSLLSLKPCLSDRQMDRQMFLLRIPAVSLAVRNRDLASFYSKPCVANIVCP